MEHGGQKRKYEIFIAEILRNYVTAQYNAAIYASVWIAISKPECLYLPH